MTVNKEVKGTLARLLATENLNVEHRRVSTAYFDITNRTLCLPIWKDVSGEVYDLMVGHEVGHALYTPQEYKEYRTKIPGDVLNIFEDVRVEKLMKRRYPGLSRSFYRGYNEMNDKNYFELDGKDISKMSFLDRINIHYKLGIVCNKTVVPFSDAEKELLGRIGETETFDDVIELCREYVEFVENQKEEQQVENNDTSPEGEESEEDTQPTSDTSGNGPDNESTEDTDSSEEQSGPQSHSEQSEEKNSSAEPESSASSNNSAGRNSQFESETAQALDKNQQNIVDKYGSVPQYVDIPKFDVNTLIVPYKIILNDLKTHYNNVRLTYPLYLSKTLQNYKKYKRTSIKTVNYLVKEFECKKSADQYYRASTSKTGVLDTQKLHTYMWNEDLFKRVTTIPDGKNHGLIFFLDWSGSMANIMLDTIKQLYDLIWFCKKVNIPFRVYGFSDSLFNDSLFEPSSIENDMGMFHIPKAFKLLEFFSSKMNSATLDKQMENIWCQASFFESHSNWDARYGLSGTPLTETVVVTREVLNKFRSEEKVQKANVIYLTDGEACYPTITSSYNNVPYGQSTYSSSMYYLRDPITKYSRLMDSCYSYSLTSEYMSFLKNIVDCNILGFRICNKGDMKYIARHVANITDISKLEKEWDKNKSAAIPNCGFDELYAFSFTKKNNRFRYYGNQNLDDSEENSETEEKPIQKLSKSQLTTEFKNHMNSKMSNKMILSKFIAKVA